VAKNKSRLFRSDPAKGEQRSVPFLRPFEWVATALQTFRERPLPSSYTPTVQPTFDLFSSSRLGQYQVEQVVGALGSIEIFGELVPRDRYRLYLSVDVFHNDGVAHKFLFNRVVPDPTLGFPTVNFFTPERDAIADEHIAVQNIIVPQDGRIDIVVSLPSSMGAGARMQMRSLFIELDAGEPSGGLIGGR